MGYAAAPRVAFIVYGIQTFFTAIIIIIVILKKFNMAAMYGLHIS